MQKLKRKLIIRDFLETTSFHGLYYLGTENKLTKILWFIVVLVSSLLIILSTVLILNRYLSYEYHMITGEQELDKLEEIPNLLVCSSHKLAMVDSILELKPGLNLSTAQLNYSFFEELKNEFRKINKIILQKCEVNIRSKKIDCMKFNKSVVFTFNGFCLLINFQELKQTDSLLMKEYNSLRYFDESKIHFFIKTKEMMSNSLSFKFVNSNQNEYSLNDLIFLLNSYSYRASSTKHYDVVGESIEYDLKLYNRRCVEQDEFTCHYKCLQKRVKEVLRCNFDINPINSTELPDCTIKQLDLIEKLIERYSVLNYSCNECLPSCKSFKYNLNENSFLETLEVGFKWNFYLNFKKTEIRYILNYNSATLLNFISGLWSLLFGISILSIWEIIELFIFIITNNSFLSKRKYVKFRGIRCNKTIIRYMHSIFDETCLHGFKDIFTGSRTKSVKTRWVILIILAILGFCFIVSNLVEQYNSHGSNLVTFTESLYSNRSYLNRKLSFFACKPLDFVNKSSSDFYEKLDKISNEYFESGNLTLKETIKNYKTLFINNVDHDTILDLYSTVFLREDIQIRVGILKAKEEAEYVKSEIYFDRECVWYHSNSTISDWHDQKIEQIFFDSSNSFEIFLLDSQSLQMSAESLFKAPDDVEAVINGVLKYKKLLQSPFKPSCNSESGYKQHECYQKCFNEIIYRFFGCHVIFGEPQAALEYCHPWMLPLIKNYDKHVLKKLNSDPCINCKKPCEYFYYSLKCDFVQYFEVNLISNIIVITEQIVLITSWDILIFIFSYAGLLFGCSFLAIMQIIFNILTSMFLQKRYDNSEFKFLEKVKLLNLFSKSTTVHCAKQLSPQKKNNYKKLFWLIVMIISIAIAISVSFIEIMKYNQSKLVSQTTEFNGDYCNNAPKMDICRPITNPFVYLKSKWKFDDQKKAKLQKILNDLHFKNSNLSSFVNNIFDQFKSKINTNKDFMILLNLTWSRLISDYTESYMGRLKTSQGMNWKRNELIDSYYSFNKTLTKVYQTSLLYLHASDSKERKEFVIYFCKSIEIKEILKSPLTNIKLNQVGITFEHVDYSYPKDYHLYLNNFLLPPNSDYLANNGDFKKIKSLFKDYDYKFNCKDKVNCIFNQAVLEDYSEHQLFLCNDEFKQTIYNVFNCTPFINKTTAVPECSIPFALLISRIMAENREDLYKCELSTAAHPIEFDDIFIAMNYAKQNTSLIGIDLNGMKIYKQNIVHEYDSLQLIVNVSNWLNVIIGFSFITICEFLFILFIHYKSSLSKKVSNFS